MSTPTIAPTGGDLDVDIDWQAWAEQTVACEAPDCDSEATHRITISRWSICSCNRPHVYCRTHADFIRAQMSTADLWRCSICYKIGPAGIVIMTAL